MTPPRIVLRELAIGRSQGELTARLWASSEARPVCFFALCPNSNTILARRGSKRRAFGAATSIGEKERKKGRTLLKERKERKLFKKKKKSILKERRKKKEKSFEKKGEKRKKSLLVLVLVRLTCRVEPIWGSVGHAGGQILLGPRGLCAPVAGLGGALPMAAARSHWRSIVLVSYARLAAYLPS